MGADGAVLKITPDGLQCRRDEGACHHKDSVNDEKDLCFSRMIFEEQESTVDITVKNDRVTTIDYYQ